MKSVGASCHMDQRRHLNPITDTKFSGLRIIKKISQGLLLMLCFTACAMTDMAIEFDERPEIEIPMTISIRPCVDRTDTEAVDLGAQASAAFSEQLNAAKEFSVQQAGQYTLSCEITSYVPGNAVKRWVLPGWGATTGQVTTMIQDAKTGEILIIVEGIATVAAGGLYTIGADEYIVPTAVKDVVAKLCAWVRGESNDNGTGENKQN